MVGEKGGWRGGWKDWIDGWMNGWMKFYGCPEIELTPFRLEGRKWDGWESSS